MALAAISNDPTEIAASAIVLGSDTQHFVEHPQMVVIGIVEGTFFYTTGTVPTVSFIMKPRPRSFLLWTLQRRSWLAKPIVRSFVKRR